LVGVRKAILENFKLIMKLKSLFIIQNRPGLNHSLGLIEEKTAELAMPALESRFPGGIISRLHNCMIAA
jgi:hypothetical protein